MFFHIFNVIATNQILMDTNYSIISRMSIENTTHPCFKPNRICLNSHQKFVNISEADITVTGQKVVKSGYVNASELPEKLQLKEDYVHTYYIDLEKELETGMNFSIVIQR